MSQPVSFLDNPSGPPRRILVIEDNLDAAESLRDVLEMDGHQVALAFDGPSGIQEARKFHPEVVLCDIGLPGEMDGYGVAREFRRDPALSTAFMVALTGYAAVEDQRRAADAGFDRHLAKPPDLEDLERMLATCSERS